MSTETDRLKSIAAKLADEASELEQVSTSADARERIGVLVCTSASIRRAAKEIEALAGTIEAARGPETCTVRDIMERFDLSERMAGYYIRQSGVEPVRHCGRVALYPRAAIQTIEDYMTRDDP